MFKKSLPNVRQWELLKIVRLLQVLEAPLLWDGKTEDELTGNADLSNVNFAISDGLQQAWENAARIYGDEDDIDDEDTTGVINHVLDEIRALRIHRQNDPQERLQVAKIVLQEKILRNSTISDKPKQQTKFENLGSFLASPAAWPFAQSSNSASSTSENTPTLLPKHSRIVLFEAMRFSLSDGGLSDSKRNLLQVASVAYGVDGESFNELLAQAIALQKEIKRSVNLVLE